MPTNATRLSDRQLKAVKATGKDFVLSDGDGLQLRVRQRLDDVEFQLPRAVDQSPS